MIRSVPSGSSRWKVVLRAASAIGIFVVGSYAASQSLALTMRTSNNGLAYRLAPSDARILSVRTKILTEGTTQRARWDQAAALARRALLRDPLSGTAAATVGLHAAMQGNERIVTDALAYARGITRRDLRTNLWAIENQVMRNDIPGALRDYDVALRTSTHAPDILFPVLAGAVADDDVRAALVPTLVRAPVWTVPFLRYVAETAPDHQAAATLFGDLRRRGVALPQGTEASLLGALVTAGDYATARRYLANAGLPVDGSRYPTFAGNPPSPSPFDWNMSDASGVSATVQQDGDAGILAFSTVGGASGPIARQLQLLPPGRYDVVSALASIKPADARLYWSAQCVDGVELGRIALSSQVSDRPVVNGSFTVPATCPALWWTLVAPFDNATDINGELRYAAIRGSGTHK